MGPQYPGFDRHSSAAWTMLTLANSDAIAGTPSKTTRINRMLQHLSPPNLPVIHETKPPQDQDLSVSQMCLPCLIFNILSTDLSTGQ